MLNGALVKASLVAVPAMVVMLVLSVAVTVYVATVVPVVNVTLATPLAFVVLVPGESDPPLPVLLHITVLPEVETTLPLVSANCAVIATLVPAAGLKLLDVTRYCVAVPALVVMFPLVPL